MKSKTFIAIAVTMLVTSAHATEPIGTVSKTGSVTNTVNSVSIAGSYVAGQGKSVSKATNTQTASGYVHGSGFLRSSPTNQFVSILDCEPLVEMPGTLDTGAARSYGGSAVYGKSTALNVSSGAGVGDAVAGGFSVVEVVGKTTAVSDKMNLSAEGASFSALQTGTSAITNVTAPISEGNTSSSFRSVSKASLFTYSTPQATGDVKTSSTSVKTRSGDLNCVGGCANLSSLSIANNAVVEAGASGNSTANVTLTVTKP